MNQQLPITKSTSEGVAVVNCPNCEGGPVATVEIERRFQYGEGADAVELSATVPLRKCPHCGFQFLDEAAEEAEEAAVRRHLQVMTPRQLTALRGMLQYSLRGLAELTRIGVASLQRWESGASIQNPAYDDYLYLLGWQQNVDRLRHRRERQLQAPAAQTQSSFRAIIAEEHLAEARSFSL